MKIRTAISIFGTVLLFVSAFNGQETIFTTSAKNIVASRAIIDLPQLNGNPDAIIVATPLGDTARLNPHPIGAWYYNGKWCIFNTNHANMPAGLSYKIQVSSKPDAAHFLHISSRESINATATYIDNPALNNNPSAQLTIFQNYAPDYRSPYYLNPSEAVVAYSAETAKWYISNSNGKALYPGAAYNVVILSAGMPGSANATIKPTGTPATSVATAAPTSSTLPAPVSIARPARTNARSVQLGLSRLNEFPKKGLPAAATISAENLDLAAITMAQVISARGEQALPTLLAALQTSGFTVLDTKGKVLLKPIGTGQGLGFYDFEAVGSLKLADRGVTIALNKLASTIVRNTPQVTSERFAEFILREVKDHAENSQNANLRFWGRLIIELGKSSGQPHDLTTAVPGEVKLTVLQASLILRRLQGDLYALSSKGTGRYEPSPPLSNYFVNASWSHAPFNFGSAGLVDGPCHVTGDLALFLDAAAIPLTTFTGYAMEQFAKDQAALGSVAKGVGYANIVLAWGKLVMAVTSIAGEITVEQPLPLVRTKNAETGERRLMKARVWSEVGDLEVLNCVRPAINLATGLDFNLPTSGPLGDIAIAWYFEGENSSAQTLKPFVAFEAPSRDSPGDERTGDPTKQVTNADGVSQMWLVGTPKIPAVVYQRNPVKVRKEAKVRVEVTLKSAKDTAQNWIDIVGAGVGAYTGGPIILIGSAAEIGFRIPYVAARETIPVTDHEECSGGWVGTVTYTVIRSKTTITGLMPKPQIFLGGTDTHEQDVTLSGTVTVNSKNGQNSQASASADEITTVSHRQSERAFCGLKGGNRTVASGHTVMHTANGNIQAATTVYIEPGNDYYKISVMPPGVPTILTTRWEYFLSNGCPGQSAGPPTTTTSNTEYKADMISAQAPYGEDKSTLSGSQTIEKPWETATITWNLQRCGG